MTRESVLKQGFVSAKCQTARASFRSGLSTLNISRTASTGDGKNITPKRLTTASKVSAGNGRWSAKATSKCAFLNPRRSAARRAAATISGTGSIPKTLPSGPTKAATVKAGSPGPVAISSTVWRLPIRASSTRACVTGANICRMISRCFSQKGAAPLHPRIISSLPWGAWSLVSNFLRKALVHFLDSQQRGRPGANQSAARYGRHQANRRDVVGQIHDHNDIVFAKTVMDALEFSADSLDDGFYGSPTA